MPCNWHPSYNWASNLDQHMCLIKITYGEIAIPSTQIHSITETHSWRLGEAWNWHWVCLSIIMRPALMVPILKPDSSILYTFSKSTSGLLSTSWQKVSNHGFHMSIVVPSILDVSINFPTTVCKCGWQLRKLRTQSQPSGGYSTCSIDLSFTKIHPTFADCLGHLSNLYVSWCKASSWQYCNPSC
jgi:hypothetical protein